MIKLRVLVCEDHEVHLGTKFFQILPRQFSSSPLTLPSLLASQLGSLRPKMEKSWLAVVVSIYLRVRLESSSVLRSLRRASAFCLLAILSRLARLYDEECTVGP